ncbi:MAG TPA: hypothetical protein VNW95_15280 [Mucilaginibacter sp.]|jgi:hypothetical protein|nr:hypothetical protein [Mucilaginibacter sp.]
MKKSTKHLACLFTIIFTLGINSCKKDTIPQKMSAASTEVQPQEILAWYKAFPHSSELPLLWNEAVKAVVNGQPVIQIPIAKDAALFFTKTNGILNVSAYKWITPNPNASIFTGGVMIYNFNTNSLSTRVYKNGRLVKSAVFDPEKLPQPVPFTPLSPTLLPANESRFTPKTLSGIGDFFGSIACFLTGGDWSNVLFGDSYCDYSSGWGSGVFGFLSDMLVVLFGNGSGGGGGSSGSPMSGGGSYGAADGSSASVVASGGVVYVEVNSPCTISGDASPTIDPASGGGSGPCVPTTQWVADASLSYDTLDTFTGDEPDEVADDNNGIDTSPKAHLSSQITLNNGQVVNIIFV